MYKNKSVAIKPELVKYIETQLKLIVSDISFAEWVNLELLDRINSIRVDQGKKPIKKVKWVFKK